VGKAKRAHPPTLPSVVGTARRRAFAHPTTAGADNAARQHSPYTPATILSPSAADANSPIRARLIAAVRVGEAIFAPMRSVT
jgi:hypothetical protein